MTDSLTSQDIDRLYDRLENSLGNLKNIKDRHDLYRKASSHPKTKHWNTSLNDFIWNQIEKRTGIRPAYGARPETLPMRYRGTIQVKGKTKTYTKTKNAKWENWELTELIEYKKSGWTSKEISAKMGRSTSSIDTKYSRIIKEEKQHAAYYK